MNDTVSPSNPMTDPVKRERYRDVFLNDRAGREVFKDMLFELGYFSTAIQGEGATSKRNYAARLVAIVGSDNPDSSIELYLESLAKHRGGNK